MRSGKGVPILNTVIQIYLIIMCEVLLPASDTANVKYCKRAHLHFINHAEVSGLELKDTVLE